MRIDLICVGRMSREYAAVAAHYDHLLRPYLTLATKEVPEVPLTQGEARVKGREGDEILRRMRPDAYVAVLDRGGRQFASEELSAHLADLKVHGRSEFQFILGGALGLDARVLGSADLVWSLSKLTLPHQLARCVVLEQLYRAVRIERGEPYHY